MSEITACLVDALKAVERAREVLEELNPIEQEARRSTWEIVCVDIVENVEIAARNQSNEAAALMYQIGRDVGGLRAEIYEVQGGYAYVKRRIKRQHKEEVITSVVTEIERSEGCQRTTARERARSDARVIAAIHPAKKNTGPVTEKTMIEYDREKRPEKGETEEEFQERMEVDLHKRLQKLSAMQPKEKTK